MIKTLRRTTGEDYSFEDPDQPWSWRCMVKDMTTELQNQLCGDGGGGIMGIWLVALPGSYDHKRQSAADKHEKPYPAEAPVPLWDFVVHNHDGQGRRFHVGQTKKSSDIRYQGRLQDEATKPWAGEK